MSKEENKTVEEVNEEERVIEPEVIEEVKEPVIDDIKEPVAEVKAPLRGISTPSMIHTHLDNFLAKLCGETPVDDKVRNSLEFWINELAKGNGGSTKKIYSHSVNMYRGSNTNINIVVLNTSPTPMNSITEFVAWASSVEGTIIFPTSGVITVEDTTYENVFQIVKFVSPESWAFYHTTTTGFERVNIDSMSTVFLGVNDRVTTIN